MAKLVGRIPAAQVVVTRQWQLPEVSVGAESSKVFKLRGSIQQGVIRPTKSKRAPSTIESDEAPSAPLNAGESAEYIDDLPDIDALLGVSQDPSLESDSSLGLSPVDQTSEQALSSELQAESQTETEAELDLESDVESEVETPGAAEAAFDQGFRQGETEGYVTGEARGFIAGESAGREQGRQLVEQEFSAEVESKRQLLQSLQEAMVAPPEDPAAVEESLSALITRLAEVVILNELKTSPELIARLVSSALEAIPHGVTQVDVRVNPENLAWISEVVPPVDIRINYIGDKNLSIGSCRVVSESTSVDATLSKRINDCLTQVLADVKGTDINEADLLRQETAASDKIALSDKIAVSQETALGDKTAVSNETALSNELAQSHKPTLSNDTAPNPINPTEDF